MAELLPLKVFIYLKMFFKNLITHTHIHTHTVLILLNVKGCCSLQRDHWVGGEGILRT